MFRKWQAIYFLALAILIQVSCRNETVQLQRDEPADPLKSDTELWQQVSPGLKGGFGSIDVRYNRSSPPESGISDYIEKTGWRGEKISFQAVYWSKSHTGITKVTAGDLVGNSGKIDAERIQIRTVKYILADEFLDGCGYRDKDTIESHLSPDMLDNTSEFILPEFESRPVWISLKIPEDAIPGTYETEIRACSNTDTIVTRLLINVQNILLPSPDRWSYHLDLWQNPWAVARYHSVQPWSAEHLDLLKPLLEMLAGAGQKCITTTLNDRPWGGQTFDPFGSMITWLRNTDGSWEYDYSLFDLYVTLAMECGINKSISCYSMVPWQNRLTWFDQDSACYITREVIPGSEEYTELWRPFLYDFRAHLMEMGWLEITSLALDEREAEEMAQMFSFLKETAPWFKVSMAGNYFKDITGNIDDFSFNWNQLNDKTRAIAAERKKQGLITTYYVCCSDRRPNNFTFSPPAESCYEGWFAAAMGLDGFLRWAYNSWPEDPVTDSRFRRFPSGDTYMVYPGARSSVRFERLIEGIQDYEKITILREMLALDASDEAARSEKSLNDFMKAINRSSIESSSAADIINEGKMLVDSITAKIAK